MNYADWFIEKDDDDFPYSHQHPEEYPVCQKFDVSFCWNLTNVFCDFHAAFPLQSDEEQYDEQRAGSDMESESVDEEEDVCLPPIPFLYTCTPLLEHHVPIRDKSYEPWLGATQGNPNFSCFRHPHRRHL